jgi:preprotein translocase subunit SecA
MRLFAGQRIAGIMDRLGIDESVPIEHPLVTRQIESAQKKVEQYHFDVRKHVLEYDDVMNVQRKVIYGERRKVLAGENVRDTILDIVERLGGELIDGYIPPASGREDWDLGGLAEAAAQLSPALGDVDLEQATSPDDLRERLTRGALEAYERKVREIGEETMSEIERVVLLQTIDRKWIDHLYNMDSLREGIGLRAYAQVSPLIEYQREGYDLFQQMLADIQEETVKVLLRVELGPAAGSAPAARPAARRPVPVGAGAGASAGGALQPGATRGSVPAGDGKRKIGRNDPCWCGSGKKYKKCHGKDE